RVISAERPMLKPLLSGCKRLRGTFNDPYSFFLKYSAFCQYSNPALQAAQPTANALTSMEGFDAHQLSIDVRL
ncbi:hypothetical protein EBR57_09440, partial [bacterium]|nr:hypothetical protein [bacterium]